MPRILKKVKSPPLLLAVSPADSLRVFLAAVLTTWLFVVPGGAIAQAHDATRVWVLEQLHEALLPPQDLGRISSMLYGLVNDRRAAEQSATRKVLAEVETFVRAIDAQTVGCGDLVNLRFIGSFLDMAGVAFDTGPLDRQLYECLGEMNAFDRACALFSLCRFPSASAPREKLSPAVKSIEDLQQADGSFGSSYGLQRYYLTTHAVFALHTCKGTPQVVRRGQAYLRDGLPGIKQAGFLDGLLESLIMLRKMAVEIPNESRYTDYLRSRIKDNGSICFFDRPGCRSDVHATGLLLEFLREFGD